jgi:hypothetical protein
MAASMRPPRRKRTSQRPPAALALPSHWSPKQALAVFECLELMREQLWRAYGPDIQHAWRAQLVPDRAPPDFDPGEPF